MEAALKNNDKPDDWLCGTKRSKEDEVAVTRAAARTAAAAPTAAAAGGGGSAGPGPANKPQFWVRMWVKTQSRPIHSTDQRPA